MVIVLPHSVFRRACRAEGRSYTRYVQTLYSPAATQRSGVRPSILQPEQRRRIGVRRRRDTKAERFTVFRRPLCLAG